MEAPRTLTPVSERLLEGLRVVDLGGDPSARAGRVLGDLGADGRAGRAAGRRRVARERRRGRGTRASTCVALAADDAALDELLAAADVVFDTPGVDGHASARSRARAATRSGCSITPFGIDGPRSSWRALGPRRDGGEREHVLHRRPRSRAGALHRADGLRPLGARGRVRRAHRACGAANRSGRLSMQEVVLVANMVAPAQFRDDGRARAPARRQHRPHPRDLADARRLRVVRAARRQGPRRESRELIAKLVPRRRPRRAHDRTGTTFNQNTATDEELAAIETTVAEYFARHTMQELYDIACETNLMLAPTNSPREIYASAQLAARDFFGPVGDVERFPRSFVVVRAADDEVAPARRPGTVRSSSRRTRSDRAVRTGGQGVGRAEHPRVRLGRGRADRDALLRRARRDGAAHRVEDPARLPARDGRWVPSNPHGLEGSPMYDGLNVGKRNVTFNLKHPEAVALVQAARRRVGRRGRRELRTACDEGLRPRLRHARRDQARSRDDRARA